MIPALEAMRTISDRRGDAIVVSAGGALREWAYVSSRRDLDLDLWDCADKCSSVGLGVALAQPHRAVLVLDCDGALPLNLGSLITVGGAAPKNLVHFLLEDGSSVPAHRRPLSGAGRVNFKAFAEEAGYPRAYRFDDLETLILGLEEVLQEDGPTFVSLRVVHGVGITGYPARTMGESFEAVARALSRRWRDDGGDTDTGGDHAAEG